MNRGLLVSSIAGAVVAAWAKVTHGRLRPRLRESDAKVHPPLGESTDGAGNRSRSTPAPASTGQCSIAISCAALGLE